MSALRQRLALSSPSIIHTPAYTLRYTHAPFLLFTTLTHSVKWLKVQDCIVFPGVFLTRV